MSGFTLRHIVWRALVHGWRRAALLLLAVLVPATLITATANFALDGRAKMTTELARTGPNLTLTAAHGTSLSRADAERARALLQPTLWSPRLEGTIGGVPIAGTLDVPNGVCRLGALLRSRLRADYQIRFGDRELRVQVAGDEPRAQLSLADAAAVLNAEDRYTQVDAAVEAGLAELEARAAGVERAVPGVRVRPIRAIAAAQGAVLDRLEILFAWISGAVLIVGGVAMAMALASHVLDRRREIAVWRALGAPGATVVRLLLLELMLVLGLGVVLGAVLGLLASNAMAHAVFHLSVTPRPSALAAAALGCLTMTLLAAIQPIRLALAIAPGAALKEE